MWNSDAVKKIDQLITEDPENTLCEKTYWFPFGYTIKCMRKPYEGIKCDSAKHNLFWDTKYKYKQSLVADIAANPRSLERKAAQA